jgi:hypothetical protein
MRETLKVVLKKPTNFQIWFKNPWGCITSYYYLIYLQDTQKEKSP